LVDVVLQRRYLSLRFDRDGAREIALGHGGRDFGDGPHLARQIRRQLVHVVGQIPPQPRGARHFGLAAELAFDPHFAGYVGHVLAEWRKAGDHAVVGIGERGVLAFGLEYDFWGEVALGRAAHYLRDSAHLIVEVRRHEIHVVREVLPGAGNTRHLRLATEPAV